jgi:NDP-sugar pyrophosphorylase family protein
MKNIKVVYLVAGMSSRFNGKVKQFAKVGPNDETLIEMSMKHAANAGIRSIIFVVGEKTLEPFKEKFGNNYNGMKIEYAFQGYDPEKRDRPWGTCDAVVCAKNLIDGPFIVCNGMIFSGAKSFLTLVNPLCDSDEAAVLQEPKEFYEENVSRGVLIEKTILNILKNGKKFQRIIFQRV